MSTAVVVIDMINTYDFPDAEKVVPGAEKAVPRIKALTERAREEGVPVIYVNDNYGDWNSSAEELMRTALDGKHPELVEELHPHDDDAFVIKGRHSIFYGTPLEHLLKEKGVDRLVMVGQVTEQCILYSALDAHLRDLEVAVPRDAVAHIFEDLGDAALRMMERNMSADVEPSESCLLSSEG
jgi:nicotinamidase-related amidase